MIQATREFPEAKLFFYTENGELVAQARTDEQGSVIDKEVLDITTTNELAADAGTFAITLSNRRRWDKVLASNDLVFIQMRRNSADGDGKSTVMVGLIDDVRKTVSINNNQVNKAVRIIGRNFAKALINFEIGVVQDAGEIGESIGWLAGKITFTAQSSAQIIKQLYDLFVVKYMNYEFQNKKKFTDMVKLKLSSREGEKLASEMSFINYQGNMHSFFKEVIDEPFNQLFWEVYDGDPTLVVRETPFNEAKWKTLTLHTVTDKDIVTDDIGRSDLETYTLFSVGVANQFGTFGDQNSLGVKPLVYDPYLKKYGIKRLHRFSNYIGAGNTSTNAPNELAKKYAVDLFNWNVMNPRFYNGQIVVKGQNDYKVGDRLLFDSKEDGRKIEFFIESVKHDFINFNNWITTLGVTRGMENSGQGRFQVPWGAYKEYKGGGVGDPSPEEVQRQVSDAWNQLINAMGWGSAITDNSQPPLDIGEGAKGVAKYYLSSPFRSNGNFGQNRGDHIHKGEDLSAPSGTPLYSLMDGVVTKVAYQAGGAGNYIVINHANGYQTKYFHMKSRSPLSVNTRVTAGQTIIGYVGSTGRSTGPHLHLEIWINGKATNPIPILKQLRG